MEIHGTSIFSYGFWVQTLPFLQTLPVMGHLGHPLDSHMKICGKRLHSELERSTIWNR